MNGKNLLENYQPISLSHIFGKIFLENNLQ